MNFNSSNFSICPDKPNTHLEIKVDSLDISNSRVNVELFLVGGENHKDVALYLVNTGYAVNLAENEKLDKSELYRKYQKKINFKKVVLSFCNYKVILNVYNIPVYVLT